jgi:transposase InsO family protein
VQPRRDGKRRDRAMQRRDRTMARQAKLRYPRIAKRRRLGLERPAAFDAVITSV